MTTELQIKTLKISEDTEDIDTIKWNESFFNPLNICLK